MDYPVLQRGFNVFVMLLLMQKSTATVACTHTHTLQYVLIWTQSKFDPKWMNPKNCVIKVLYGIWLDV